MKSFAFARRREPELIPPSQQGLVDNFGPNQRTSKDTPHPLRRETSKSQPDLHAHPGFATPAPVRERTVRLQQPPMDELPGTVVVVPHNAGTTRRVPVPPRQGTLNFSKPLPPHPATKRDSYMTNLTTSPTLQMRLSFPSLSSEIDPALLSPTKNADGPPLRPHRRAGPLALGAIIPSTGTTPSPSPTGPASFSAQQSSSISDAGAWSSVLAHQQSLSVPRPAGQGPRSSAFSAESNYSTMSEGASPAHARVELARQHQRAMARRAFASPQPGQRTHPTLSGSVGSVSAPSTRTSFPSQRTGSEVPLLAGPSSAPPSRTPTQKLSLRSQQVSRVSYGGSSSVEHEAVEPSLIVTISPTASTPRRPIALDDGITRSRSGSLTLDSPDLTTRAALKARPHTANDTSPKREKPPLTITVSRHDLSPPSMPSPPLSYPIMTDPRARPAILDTPPRKVTPLRETIGLPRPEASRNASGLTLRPEMRHADTSLSKMSSTTVYTDASEMWSGSGQDLTPQPSPPLQRGRIGSTASAESAEEGDGDAEDFHGLFFRTPKDRRPSDPATTHEGNLPGAFPEVETNGEPIGLGYDMPSQSLNSVRSRTQTQTQTQTQRQTHARHDSTDTGGSEGTLEIATPVMLSDNRMSGVRTSGAFVVDPRMMSSARLDGRAASPIGQSIVVA